jgi:uncharacterized protein (TIGR03083 family)
MSDLLGPAEGLAATTRYVGSIRSVLATGDLDAPVPQCPGWDLRRLAWHLGDIHRWVRGALVEGHPDTVTPDGPSARPALLDWFDQGAGQLLELLAGSDPDAPCWTFGPRPGTVRFWLRRQAHEHAIHAVDAHASRSAPAGGVRIDPTLALDGIDEVAAMFFPRQVRLGRTAPLERSLAIAATDGAGFVRILAGDGTQPLGTQPLGTQPLGTRPEAEVRGPAEVLYLLLWGRTGLDDHRLELVGAPEAARSVLAAALVP